MDDPDQCLHAAAIVAAKGQRKYVEQEDRKGREIQTPVLPVLPGLSVPKCTTANRRSVRRGKLLPFVAPFVHPAEAALHERKFRRRVDPTERGLHLLAAGLPG